jgi:hypothetical protein
MIYKDGWRENNIERGLLGGLAFPMYNRYQHSQTCTHM